MPSTGIARYDGEAIVGRNGQTDAADAKFIVGFGSRSLSGRIIPLRDSKVAFSEVNFNASIDGNSFYNNGLSVGTNGNFYGDNGPRTGRRLLRQQPGTARQLRRDPPLMLRT